MHLKKIQKLLALLFIFASCSFACFAQVAEDWYYGKIIAKVRFEGTKYVKASDLTGITQTFIGKRFSDEVYFDLLGRIGALEFFETYDSAVTPGDADYNSVIITFTVVENPVVSKISFVGNRQLNNAQLKGKINIKDQEIFSAAKLANEEVNLRNYYLEKGYTNVRVSSNVNYADDGVEISFLINEGASTILRSVKFEGNQVFSERTLLSTMQSKTKSLFNKGSFQESTLEIDKQSILLYYQNRGYIDVQMTDVIREESVDERGNTVLDITFVISEGYQYTYAGISFEGNWLFSSEFLASKINLEVGDVFNYTKFSEGLTAISDVYYENGYITTGIYPEQMKDADRRQIALKLYIEERSRSHIESIVVQGNKKTKDNVIFRELPFVAGDVFSKTKLTAGMRNLMNLQFFSSVVPDILPGSEDDLVNIVMNVEDTSTTSIELGMAFSGLADANSFPVSIYANWGDTNVNGTGQSIKLGAEASFDTQSLSFSYGNNWIGGEPISYAMSVQASHKTASTLQAVYTIDGLDTTSYNMKYNQAIVSVSNTLGRRWYPNDWILSLTGGLSNDFTRNFYDKSLTPVDTTVSNYHTNWGFLNTVWGQAALDNRDYQANPSSGWFLSERVSWTGLVPKLEKQFFFRSDTTAEYYKTILNAKITDKFDLNVVFANIAKLSFIRPYKNAISDINRLYIDGVFNARGWDSIGSVKGNLLFTNSMELRAPLIPNILAADIFFDTAMLRSSGENFLKNISSNEMYFSFGPGIRSLVPQLPIRVLLANTFKVDSSGFKWGNGRGPDLKVVLSFVQTNY